MDLRRYNVAYDVARGIALVALVGKVAEKAILSTAPDSSDPRQAEGQQMVNEIAAKRGVPAPPFVLLEWDKLPRLARRRVMKFNAFNMRAPGSKGIVVMSSKLYDELTPPERRGVLAHEMSHQIHRDGQVLVITQMALNMATVAARQRTGNHEFTNHLLAHTQKAVTGAMMRRIETRCDREGAETTNDPLALASALSKLKGIGEREQKKRPAYRVAAKLPISEERRKRYRQEKRAAQGGLRFPSPG